MIRFDGDGVRLRIKSFDCSSHDREAVLDPRVLPRSEGSRRVSRRSMKGAEQSYKHQTDEWQCELHLDPFICPNVKSKGEAEQWWAQVSMEKER